MSLTLAVTLLLLAAPPAPAAPLTVVEKTTYARTSLHAEVLEHLHAVARSSPLVTLATLATSAEGREVPLVVLSKERVRTPAELRASGKPAVLVMANIHAGEVEGKEACQMLVREVGQGRLAGLLEHQVVLVVPIFNADGNDKLGRNRRDHGPELAGVRHNGQYLDLNRDYTKLESPEVTALVRLMVEWDPVLVVDMHTTNGSHHREPLTYTTGIHPNTATALRDYMWRTLFPAVAEKVGRAGWTSVPYGNFVDRFEPGKGWENDSVEARYGSNYVALRNRLAILDENYSYTDFRTRVLSSLAFVEAVLEFTDAHAAEIVDLVRAADAETRLGFRRDQLATAWKLEPLLDVTVRSFEFEKVPLTPEEKVKYPWYGEFRASPTAVQRDYTLPYLARATATASVPLPAGYVLLPGFDEVVDTLVAHGIAVERLLAPARLPADRFALEKVQPAKEIYQGRVMVTLEGRYQAQPEAEFPAGSVFVDMEQPLARLVAILLEPASVDGLAAFGFFNRSLVQQWSAEPGTYPVLRVGARPPVPMRTVTARER